MIERTVQRWRIPGTQFPVSRAFRPDPVPGAPDLRPGRMLAVNWGGRAAGSLISN